MPHGFNPSEPAETRSEGHAIARVAEALTGHPPGTGRLLLFDFDGTLCDLVRGPDRVWLPPHRRELLRELASQSDTTVGIVSGRRLADVRDRVGLDSNLYYAGLHGLEMEGAGLSFVHEEVASSQGLLQLLARSLQALTSSLPRVLVENKGLSVALHVRDAAPTHRVEAEAALYRVAGRHIENDVLRLQRGDCVLELLPNIDWNKGTAVRKLRDSVARKGDRPPLVGYVGDDLADEDAFEAIGAEGVTVVVGDRPSHARYRLKDTTEVESLLRCLVQVPNGRR